LSQSIGMSYTDFWLTLKNRSQLVSVKKLRLLSSYLNIDYDYLNDKISKIRKGKIASIRNPKFPLNIATPEGATILGNVVSDGCIYIDKKARNAKRTKYSAATQEELEKFINNINKIFGEVHITREKTRNSTYLRIGSSVVGDALEKMGAHIGNKSEIDRGLPWLIKEGRENLKIAYLRAIFDDEGSFGGHKNQIYGGKRRRDCFITLSRSIHINNRLTEHQKRTLEKIKPQMKKSKFPTGHKKRAIQITKAVEALKKNDYKSNLSLIKLLLNAKPRLLLDESKLLQSLNIQNRIRNSVLTITNKGTYSITSELRIIAKADVINFYRKINFGLSSKQKKLRKHLINTKWI